MTSLSNIPDSAAASRGSAFGDARAEIEELLAQMAQTSDPDALAQMADRLKMLTQQPANDLHTFDRSELPEWAVDDADQEVMDAFFNNPAERGAAETAFAIPRGQSTMTGTGAMEPVIVAVAEAPDAPEAAVSAAPEVVEPVAAPEPVAVPEPVASSEPVVESVPEPAAAPEPIVESVPESIAAPEPAVEFVSEPEAVEPAESAEVTPEVVEPEEVEDASEAGKSDDGEEAQEAPKASKGGFSFGKDKKAEPEPPRREDFARFHCIYESRDGQLALYEDEDGHISAVNTNRFI